MNDALHHMRVGKCELTPGRRRRNDFDESEITYDFTTEPLTTMTMSEEDNVTGRQSEWITAGKFSDKLDLNNFQQETDDEKTPDRLDHTLYTLIEFWI